MQKRWSLLLGRRAWLTLAAAHLFAGCKEVVSPKQVGFDALVLDYNTPMDAALQAKVEAIDSEIRARHGMGTEHAAVALADLRQPRMAMIHPDRITYAASVAKIGILLAYFQLRPAAAQSLDPQTRQELGLMVKASSNELAAKFSQELGLMPIQEVLNSYGFYSAKHGGGLWVGRHYGQSHERHGDPLADHSHAATARQVLRFYLLLEQAKLVSPEASKVMREIFLSPSIPHDAIKFVKGLEGRAGLEIRRKWGTWENWRHDSAVITGLGRHYILVGLTEHPQGDEYLVELAREIDDLMQNAVVG
jgi:beta-lactamase class A